eukprot:scaffold282389_cov44-Tisochrysis_lutea.AAC.1
MAYCGALIFFKVHTVRCAYAPTVRNTVGRTKVNKRTIYHTIYNRQHKCWGGGRRCTVAAP